MAIIIIAVLYILATSSALDEEVCRSESCNYFAANLRSGMNLTMDPCTDFYEYVCGNWKKNHPVPIIYKWLDNFEIAANMTYHRLREILEADWIDGESTAIIKAKQFYRSCINTNAIKNERDAFLMNYINETGGWPIIMSPTEWKLPRKNWPTINIEHSLVTHFSPIGILSIKHDLESSRKYIIAVAPPYSTDDFDGSKIAWKSMERVIKQIAVVFARQRESVIKKAQLKKDARGIIRLKEALWKLAKKTVTGDGEYTTIDKFQTLYDSSKPKTPTAKIDWLKCIREMFARINNLVTITGSEKIIVYDKKYFKRLSTILSRTSERDIVNLIQWHFIFILGTFNERGSIGNIKKLPSWLKCIVASELQEVLAFAWVQKYVPEETKAKVIGIASNIKIEMENMIAQSEWLDDHSKNAAKEKLANMALFIGYPGWYKNSTVLDEYYKNLFIGSSYLENVMRIKRFVLEQQLESFREPMDNRVWLPSPLDVNAYQILPMNSMVMPAGLLQMPLFAPNFPDVIDYAVIGAHIGHEITHGYDSGGIFFDKNGNWTQLWSNSTIQEYENRMQCFIDHYNRYGESGERTLDENIADSNGLRVAFKAYKKLMEKSEFRNVKLPDLDNFTAEKLFFVSYAGSWCNGLPEYMANGDEHSQGHVRVLGALSNSKDFSDSFECLEGSDMNPSKKCTIF